MQEWSLNKMFKCDKCGKCCRRLTAYSLFKELDDSTGKCKFLDGNLCSIYNDRPLYCRIDECYELFFKEIMSKEKYYELNYSACKVLKEE